MKAIIVGKNCSYQYGYPDRVIAIGVHKGLTGLDENGLKEPPPICIFFDNSLLTYTKLFDSSCKTCGD